MMSIKYKAIILSAFLIGMAHNAQAALDSYGKTVVTTSGNMTTYTPNNYYFAYRSHINYKQNQLGDLDHYYNYTWGMDLGLDFSQVEITAASITFNNIYNWDDGSYDLYVHLLDLDTKLTTYGGPAGVGYSYDGQGGGDAFASVSANPANGTLLEHYEYDYAYSKKYNPSTRDIRTKWDRDTGQGSRDITYDFTASEIAALMTYASDGIVGLGFDPDCHFYNDGISFKVTTASLPTGGEVPEPTTMLLFGTGLIGIAGMRRRRNKK